MNLGRRRKDRHGDADDEAHDDARQRDQDGNQDGLVPFYPRIPNDAGTEQCYRRYELELVL